MQYVLYYTKQDLVYTACQLNNRIRTQTYGTYKVNHNKNTYYYHLRGRY